MGVVFFIINAVFALVLLLLVLGSSCYALYSKNPETRYQPMRDDRGSFLKSSQALSSTELDALSKTARGDKPRLDLDDDRDFSTPPDASTIPPPSSSDSTQAPSYHEEPVQPSLSYFPPSRGDTRSPQPQYQRTGPSDLPLLSPGGTSRAPSPFDQRPSPPVGAPQNDNSRWHVGAGYDH